MYSLQFTVYSLQFTVYSLQFTVYSAGHSTPWSSSPAPIYLIYIRLMLHFLFLITLYLNLYTTVFHYIFISSSLSLFSFLLFRHSF
jgi:hypothetical protein